MFEPGGFSEENVLMKKVLATLLRLFGVPGSDSAPPHSDSAPGELRPLAPS